MNCIDFERQARDWIRAGGLPPEAERHAVECAECALLLERNRALSAALGDLARASRTERTTGGVDRRLMEAFRGRQARRPVRLVWMAIAAAAVIAVVLIGYRSRGPGVARSVPPPDQPFYAIGPGSAIEPDGFAPVIRMRLPRRDLNRIGLAAWGPAAGDEVSSLEVEVLVGRDGVAKAVRLAGNVERIRQ